MEFVFCLTAAPGSKDDVVEALIHGASAIHRVITKGAYVHKTASTAARELNPSSGPLSRPIHGFMYCGIYSIALAL